MANTVARLMDAGFRRVGYWQEDHKTVLHFEDPIPSDAGVYAIAVNDEIRYVGAAQGGLHKRFLKYKSHTNKGTVAVRLRRFIADALHSGAKVSVLVVTPPKPFLQWRGLPINGIAGLEEGLIQELSPLWNRRGIQRWEELKEQAEDA